MGVFASTESSFEIEILVLSEEDNSIESDVTFNVWLQEKHMQKILADFSVSPTGPDKFYDENTISINQYTVLCHCLQWFLRTETGAKKNNRTCIMIPEQLRYLRYYMKNCLHAILKGHFILF